MSAGLGEGQIAKSIEDDEVHAGQMLSYPALPPIAGLGLKPVNEVDHVVEPAASARSDTASGNGDGEVALAGAGPTNQHDIALLGDKPAAGQVIDQRLVDRRALEGEVIEVLGERQLGDGELVFDRARLLLVDLGAGQIADNALRFMLSLDGGGRDLVLSRLPARKVGCAL